MPDVTKSASPEPIMHRNIAAPAESSASNRTNNAYRRTGMHRGQLKSAGQPAGKDLRRKSTLKKAALNEARRGERSLSANSTTAKRMRHYEPAVRAVRMDT